MPRKPTTVVTFRPLADLVWSPRKRRSRLGWERTAIGGVVYAFGSLASIKQSIFKAAATHVQDPTWLIERAPSRDTPDGAPCWRCKRVA